MEEFVAAIGRAYVERLQGRVDGVVWRSCFGSVSRSSRPNVFRNADVAD